MSENQDQCVIKETIRGKLVIFSIENYNKHKDRHRELEQEEFCPARILRALRQPTFFIKGHVGKYRRCYYLEEFSFNGVTRYTKVVVEERNKHTIFIITAFRVDHVQEDKYGHIRETF